MKQATRSLELYQRAVDAICTAGFSWEVDWQRARTVSVLTEQDLLRESAWVILCSGFREKIVRESFDYISLCFCDWESAAEILRCRDTCIRTALYKFRNTRKLHAIAEIAAIISFHGFAALNARLHNDPIAELQVFPFIGPITSWHLAKNLGFNVAKNDRHLARMAIDLGYRNAHDLCRSIASRTGELEAVIDVVLWRYATLQSERQLSFCF